MTATAGDAGLQERLGDYRRAVDAALGELVAATPGEDPVRSALRYALSAGGKRLRPILCLAAIDAVRGAGASDGDEPAERWHTDAAGADAASAEVRAATAVELIHTYSLVHDDLPCMDDDDLRRGQPTTHRMFGTRAAMLAGVALVPLACRTLLSATAELGLPPASRRRALQELCAGAGAAGMVGGQVLDLEAEGTDVGIDGLRRIHRMKTGALFRAALRIGGVVAGADAARLHALGTFGDRLGMAFQIADDVLDVTTDSAALGKTPGKDRDARKPTFASRLGVPAARATARAEADAAVAALEGAGIDSRVLAGLARFAVDRER